MQLLLLTGHVHAQSMQFSMLHDTMPIWAARYNTWLLIKLTPKGVVFSFLFFSFLFFSFLFFSFLSFDTTPRDVHQSACVMCLTEDLE